jgi:hypothetical protein
MDGETIDNNMKLEIGYRCVENTTSAWATVGRSYLMTTIVVGTQVTMYSGAGLVDRRI